MNSVFRAFFKIKYPKAGIPEPVKIIKKIENLRIDCRQHRRKISVEGYNIKTSIKNKKRVILSCLDGTYFRTFLQNRITMDFAN